MNAPNKKDALGKGIRSLLQNIDADLKSTAGSLKTEVVEKTTATARIPLDQIEINPKQPRRDFDETALSELAASIKLHDIIQPLKKQMMLLLQKQEKKKREGMRKQLLQKIIMQIINQQRLLNQKEQSLHQLNRRVCYWQQMPM